MRKTNGILVTFMLLAFFISSASAQKSEDSYKENYFKQNSYKRIHFGVFHSYFDDNIGILTAGCDYGLKLINLRPKYNLIDFEFGSNIMMGFDEKHDPNRARPIYARIVPGLELNWTLRLYVLPIKSIEARIFLEGSGMTFVYYAKPYPNNGTNINIGSHVGMGMDYQINAGLRGYTSLKLFHTSNGKEFENNPALNAIGVVMGLQF